MSTLLINGKKLESDKIIQSSISVNNFYWFWLCISGFMIIETIGLMLATWAIPILGIIFFLGFGLNWEIYSIFEPFGFWAYVGFTVSMFIFTLFLTAITFFAISRINKMTILYQNDDKIDTLFFYGWKNDLEKDLERIQTAKKQQ